MTFKSDCHYSATPFIGQRTTSETFSLEDLEWIVRLQNEERQTVAHQLRESVGQVLTCCKLLLETRQPENEQRIMEMVNKHLQKTIGEIMHLSYKLTEDLK